MIKPTMSGRSSCQTTKTFYQMAVGAKLVEKVKPFLPDNIGQLIGKAFQFEVQVGFNDKGYYFEMFFQGSFRSWSGCSQI